MNQRPPLPLLAALAAAFCLVLCAAAPPVQAEEANPLDGIVLFTEEFPPFNYTENGTLKGLSVDILARVFERLGRPGKEKQTRVLPWANAYRRLNTQADVCLFSTAMTEKRKQLFIWIGPIAPITPVLFARKDKRIRIDSDKDLGAYLIGAVRDDLGEQILTAKGLPKEDLDIAADVQSNLRKLARGRIDLFSYENIPAFWLMRQHGFDPDAFEVVYVLDSFPLYLACNPGVPEAAVKAMQEAVDALRDQGVIQGIVDSYLK